MLRALGFHRGHYHFELPPPPRKKGFTKKGALFQSEQADKKNKRSSTCQDRVGAGEQPQQQYNKTKLKHISRIHKHS